MYASAVGKSSFEQTAHRLLRHCRNPVLLNRDPACEAICAFTGEPNPLRALRRIVEEALPSSSFGEFQLRSLILRMDVDGALTAGDASKEFGFSRSKVQRMRTAAVQLIADRLRTVFDGRRASDSRTGTTPVHLPDVKQRTAWAGPPAADERFDAECSAFADARERGAAMEMFAVSKNLRRLASDATLLKALRMQAEAKLRVGKVSEGISELDCAIRLASERSDSNEFAALTLLRAEVDLFHGDAASAKELAGEACRILDEGSQEWTHGQHILARSLHEPRQLPVRGGTLKVSGYEEARNAIFYARNACADGQWSFAREAAQCVLIYALENDSDALEAQANAALAEVKYGCGALEESHALSLRALRAMLRSRDHLVAYDLFSRPSARPRLTDGAVLNAVEERIRLHVPQVANDGPAQAFAVRDLLKGVLEASVERARRSRSLEIAAHRVRTTGSAFAAYGPPALPDLQRLLGLVLLTLRGEPAWTATYPLLGKNLAFAFQELDGCVQMGLPVGFPNQSKSRRGIA